MITLLVGGASSGKSEAAEQLAARLPQPVTYVATGWAADPEMEARIESHRSRRPRAWSTVEVGPSPDLGAALRGLRGSVLVDSLGAWLARLERFEGDVDGLCESLVGRGGDTVAVSDEVGLGVHPSTEAGRAFRDALGAVNRRVAAVADRTFLVVAGRVLELGQLERPR